MGEFITRQSTGELLDLSNTCEYFENTIASWRTEKANLKVFYGIRNNEEISENAGKLDKFCKITLVTFSWVGWCC